MLRFWKQSTNSAATIVKRKDMGKSPGRCNSKHCIPLGDQPDGCGRLETACVRDLERQGLSHPNKLQPCEKAGHLDCEEKIDPMDRVEAGTNNSSRLPHPPPWRYVEIWQICRLSKKVRGRSAANQLALDHLSSLESWTQRCLEWARVPCNSRW